jgi:hypothetical protein
VLLPRLSRWFGFNLHPPLCRGTTSPSPLPDYSLWNRCGIASEDWPIVRRVTDNLEIPLRPFKRNHPELSNEPFWTRRETQKTTSRVERGSASSGNRTRNLSTQRQRIERSVDSAIAVESCRTKSMLIKHHNTEYYQSTIVNYNTLLA